MLFTSAVRRARLARLLPMTALLAIVPAAAAQTKLIFDTDYESDVDDVGALAMLHALADNGEVQVLATIGTGLHPWSAPAMDVINTYYGRGAIPVANIRGSGVNIHSPYAQHLAQNFPQTHNYASGVAAPDAVAMYRQLLAAHDDNSVTIVTVGYATNLKNLLASGPDQHSPLSGADLVAQKVDKWVNMGGNFEQRSMAAGFPYDQNTTNNNWTHDRTSAATAVREWPTEIVFNGREIGHSMRAGAALGAAPADSPVRVAYERFFGGGAPRDHHLADQSAVLYAVRGLGHGDDQYWELEHGQININNDASFTWNVGATGPRVESRMMDALSPGATNSNLLHPSQIQRIISDLMVQTPRGPDTTGPSAVANPVAVASTQLAGRMHLSWSPAAETDVGSWVGGYHVYRNGEFIGHAYGTSFVDQVPSVGEHQYTVRAYNASGTLGEAAQWDVTATTQVGNGQGLQGEYFNNTTLSGDPVLTRLDPAINFNWGTGSPADGVNNDRFSVRWSGQIEATHAQDALLYTFTLLSNDGARMWIDGQQVVDSWRDGGGQVNTVQFEMEAGQRYDLVLEYYENTASSSVELRWELPGLLQEAVPTNRLYAIPEPASLSLLVFGGALLARRR